MAIPACSSYDTAFISTYYTCFIFALHSFVVKMDTNKVTNSGATASAGNTQVGSNIEVKAGTAFESTKTFATCGLTPISLLQYRDRKQEITRDFSLESSGIQDGRSHYLLDNTVEIGSTTYIADGNTLSVIAIGLKRVPPGTEGDTDIAKLNKRIESWLSRAFIISSIEAVTTHSAEHDCKFYGLEIKTVPITLTWKIPMSDQVMPLQQWRRETENNPSAA